VAEPNALTHYGVKGMKWGRRKSEDSGQPEVQVFRGTGRSPSKIKTRKGGDLPASEDAVKADAYKQAAKKSGPNALSNAELKVLVERMNLERQYSTLNPSIKKVAGKAVADMLVQMGKQEVRRIAQDQLTKKVAKAMAGR